MTRAVTGIVAGVVMKGRPMMGMVRSSSRKERNALYDGVGVGGGLCALLAVGILVGVGIGILVGVCR